MIESLLSQSLVLSQIMGLEVFRCYLALLLRRRANVKIDLFTTQKGNELNFALTVKLKVQHRQSVCLRFLGKSPNPDIRIQKRMFLF